MFSLFPDTSTPIIIAFSGGPDSVFLAESFLEQGYKNCVIAHFNHHMENRNGENIDDEIFAKAYSKKKNCTFELGHWEQPENSEEKARKARYTFLESVRQKHNAKAIVTAHHKNDVAETVLLQFFRSGGIKSLSGISHWNETRKLWRPLLDIDKKEILSFLSQHNITFCTDASNNESVFLRNFLRNDIIPLLETRFPSLQDHIASQSKNFRQLEKDIEQKAEEIFNTKTEKNQISRKKIQSQIQEVQISVLRIIIKNKTLSKGFIANFLDFIANAENGKKLQLDSIMFTVQKETLLWERSD